MKNKLNLIAITCLAMVLARMLYAENIKLIFLIWNLFLAWIPYYTSSYLVEREKELNLFKTISLFAISICFLPNAVYLITDLIHLKPRTGIPLWYDAIILFYFSLLGLIYNTITLINIERFAKCRRYILVVGRKSIRRDSRLARLALLFGSNSAAKGRESENRMDSGLFPREEVDVYWTSTFKYFQKFYW